MIPFTISENSNTKTITIFVFNKRFSFIVNRNTNIDKLLEHLMNNDLWHMMLWLNINARDNNENNEKQYKQIYVCYMDYYDDYLMLDNELDKDLDDYVK